MSREEALAIVETVLDKREDDLVDLRRDLHAHPELSWRESRTTDLVCHHLDEVGWRLTRTGESGLIADLGDGDGPRVALRADLDALPVNDTTPDPWRSQVPGVAHACGHDVHTTALLGAGLALAEVHAAGRLPGRVRLLFQPAEEVMPGGAARLMEIGALDDVTRIFCLHCDPTIDVGHVGLREGPVTGAADSLEIRLSGSGGHTSRPHLTEDLTFALAKIVTELPSVLSRRLDPRVGVSLVWGRLGAGRAVNVIPDSGTLAGTVRMLDAVAWSDMEERIRRHVAEIVAPYGVRADVDYQRGVPPVVNDAASVALLGRAVDEVLGTAGRAPTSQSLGGEDFAWYLTRVSGAMGRLGTRQPGGPTYDIHQGNLRVDERATAIGAKVLAGVALGAI
ncbi:MAG TPA: amidohydrolase [Nocardioides sp.]|uniref:amidohydrolase n=1 Tax=Nocardioides sp. TaxID=35761 RepID=UPI002F40DBC4